MENGNRVMRKTGDSGNHHHYKTCNKTWLLKCDSSPHLWNLKFNIVKDVVQSLCSSNSHSVMSDPWQPQAPLSVGFSRQEYWSELPFPSPEDLPDPGTEPRSPVLQVDSLLSVIQGLWRWKRKITQRKK